MCVVAESTSTSLGASTSPPSQAVVLEKQRYYKYRGGDL